MFRIFILASILALCVAPCANAQQSGEGRVYISPFKYSASAIKSLVETPQDREVQLRKLAEAFRGKLVGIYFGVSAPDSDGFVL